MTLLLLWIFSPTGKLGQLQTLPHYFQLQTGTQASQSTASAFRFSAKKDCTAGKGYKTLQGSMMLMTHTSSCHCCMISRPQFPDHCRCDHALGLLDNTENKYSYCPLQTPCSNCAVPALHLTPPLLLPRCGPCKLIYPELVKLSAELSPAAQIVKFNCNQANKELAKTLGIKVAPTFHVYKVSQDCMTKYRMQTADWPRGVH